MGLGTGEGRNSRLRELDGWRAISVLLVIVHHVLVYQHLGWVKRSDRLTHVAFHFGHLGVNTFFVISGFVICRLLLAEEARFGGVSLKAFYLRRIFRILPPLYLYVLTVVLLLSVGWILEHWNSVLYGSLFLADIRTLPTGWFLGHTWSLAVEEQFYLLFPPMFVAAARQARARIVVLIFVLLGLSSVFLAAAGRLPWIPLSGFACICCGVCMAFHEEQVRASARRVPTALIAVVAVMLLLHPAPKEGCSAAFYESFVVPAAIGLLLMFSLERGPALRNFLCSRPVQAVGVTSYGIYLWQQLFTARAEDFAGAGRVISYLLPLLFVVVPLSYFFVEKPAMQLGRKLSDRVRAKSATALSRSREAVPSG